MILKFLFRHSSSTGEILDCGTFNYDNFCYFRSQPSDNDAIKEPGFWHMEEESIS